MPYYKNKYAIIFEPSYRYFKEKKNVFNRETLSETLYDDVEIDHSTLELPVGLRYYSYLKNSTAVYFNLLYNFNFPINNMIFSEEISLYNFRIATGYNLSLGVGYQFKKKYSVEFKYDTRRRLIRNDLGWKSNINNLNLAFGYKIL